MEPRNGRYCQSARAKQLRSLVGWSIVYYFYYIFPFKKKKEKLTKITECVRKYKLIYDPTKKEHADIRMMKSALLLPRVPYR